MAGNDHVDSEDWVGSCGMSLARKHAGRVSLVVSKGGVWGGSAMLDVDVELVGSGWGSVWWGWWLSSGGMEEAVGIVCCE